MIKKLCKKIFGQKRTLDRVVLEVDEDVKELSSSLLLPALMITKFGMINNIDFRDIIDIKIEHEFSMSLDSDQVGKLKAKVTLVYWRKI